MDKFRVMITIVLCLCETQLQVKDQLVFVALSTSATLATLLPSLLSFYSSSFLFNHIEWSGKCN